MSNSNSSRPWSRNQDVDQRFVVTPYGKGIVLATRTVNNEKKNNKGDADHPNYNNALQSRNEILAAIDCTSRNITSKSSTVSGAPINNFVMQVVELLDWDISSSSTSAKYPKMYTPSYLPSVQPILNDDVICTYGRGTVTQLPSSDSQHVLVHIKSWRLNDSSRNKVMCYLLPQHVHVVRKKTLYEMDVYEKVEYANQYKQEANTCFANQLYQQALVKYEKALDSVRYVQHDTDSNNHVRAHLVEIMITCSNNAATSCLKLLVLDQKQRQGTNNNKIKSNNNYKEIIYKYAKNALVLLDALYEKRGQKIHTLLNTKYSDDKIFGEWRAKSLLLIAKYHVEKKEHSESIQICKQIKQVFEEFKTNDNDHQPLTAIMVKQEKELKRVLATSTTQIKIEKQKEKKRAQAMFGSPTKPKTKINMNGEKNKKNEAQDCTPKTKNAKLPKMSCMKSHISQELNDDLVDYDDDGNNISTNTKGSSTSKRHVSFLETVVDNNKDANYSNGSNNKNRSATDDEDEEDEEHDSWLVNNKEALIIGAATSFLAISCMLLFRSPRGK